MSPRVCRAAERSQRRGNLSPPSRRRPSQRLATSPLDQVKQDRGTSHKAPLNRLTHLGFLDGATVKVELPYSPGMVWRDPALLVASCWGPGLLVQPGPLLPWLGLDTRPYNREGGMVLKRSAVLAALLAVMAACGPGGASPPPAKIDPQGLRLGVEVCSRRRDQRQQDILQEPERLRMARGVFQRLKGRQGIHPRRRASEHAGRTGEARDVAARVDEGGRSILGAVRLHLQAGPGESWQLSQALR